MVYIIYMLYDHYQVSVVSTLKKGNGRLGKLAMEVARLVGDEENGCRIEVQREGKNTRYTRDLLDDSCQGKVA